MQTSNTTTFDSRDETQSRHTAARITGVNTTHTNTPAQRPRAAATRRTCTSCPTGHETAQQPLLTLLCIATAAARLLLLTAAATVQCSAVPSTPTQQHSNTTTQQHSNTATQQHSNTATQQHSNTATQQHSNTATQQRSNARHYHTLPLTEIKEQHTHRHPNTQRRSYRHHYTAHSTCSSPRK
jgi:hypothetical protein